MDGQLVTILYHSSPSLYYDNQKVYVSMPPVVLFSSCSEPIADGYMGRSVEKVSETLIWNDEVVYVVNCFRNYAFDINLRYVFDEGKYFSQKLKCFIEQLCFSSGFLRQHR